MSEAKDFLGKGWKFPVRLDSKGGLAISQHEELILESIRVILSTSIGERIMRPDFGCGIYDYAFQTPDASAMGMMEESIKEALALWEPRIDIISVSASKGTLDDGRVDIKIDYKIIATNNEFNLVYPFYLKE